MDVMIDFHYSDIWADPSKQFKPAAWKNLGLAELKQAIANHTKDVLNALKSAGRYRAAANGDATSLDLFHLPQMPLFSGQLTAIVQSGEKPGTVQFVAKAPGVKPCTLTIQVK